MCNKSNKINILTIEYACEPNRGSEPGVGWNWAKIISNNERVNLTVLTRANNKEIIDNYMANHDDMKAKFIYYDLPDYILKHKNKDKKFLFFYSAWQIGAKKFLKKNIDIDKYDYIWDFNMGSLNLPSFYYKLGKKVILGPVSTKRRIPRTYIKKFKFKYRMAYGISQFIKEHLWLNIPVWRSIKKANKILLCSEVVKQFLPKKTEKDAISIFHNGIDPKDFPIISDVKISKEYEKDETISIVYAGRLIRSKNIDTAIEALGKFKEQGGKFIFYIYGDGSEKKQLIKLCHKYNIENDVIFNKKIKQQELFVKYTEADILMFPSLLEISSTSVMEAMYCGLVPLCLNIEGMKYVLDGVPVEKKNLSVPEEDVEWYVDRLKLVTKDKLIEKKRICRDYAINNYLWESKKEYIDKIIKKLIEGKNE